jgi:hypothetical protein
MAAGGWLEVDGPKCLPGESGEGLKLRREAAVLRLKRSESLPGAFRIRLRAMCFRVVKCAGACSVLMRHSSSRKTMSMTQCRLLSTAQ